MGVALEASPLAIKGGLYYIQTHTHKRGRWEYAQAAHTIVTEGEA